MEKQPGLGYFSRVKKELYIETSVWNQLEHSDRPDWKKAASRFFDTLALGYYDVCISDIVLDEMGRTKNPQRRNALISHIQRIEPVVLPFDNEAQELTEKYLQAGFMKSSKRKIYNDAAHVAVATVNQVRHIVSYNFEHLVKDIRIDKFNAVNLENGYDVMVDITTPERYILEKGDI